MNGVPLHASSAIVLPVILPLAAGLLCFLLDRKTFFIALTATLANLLAVLFLMRQFVTAGPTHTLIGGWAPPLGITLRIDGPALLMLLMTAVTGFAITLYARGYFAYRIETPRHLERHTRQERFFWPLWMMLLAGLNGLYLANDIFHLYVTLEVISIAAASLAALSGKPAAQLAAFRYLLVSLLGSLTYLLGVVFVYRASGVLDCTMLQQISSVDTGMSAAVALMSVGLLLKTALFPLHFWLPPAHANALAPVSAILSALVIKGSFYLLFRFWFDVFPTIITPAALQLLGILGVCAVFWGAMQAMRQQRLKLMVAYSTVSQIGYLFIAFPLAALVDNSQIWTMVIFMALAHACAKSAMFMAAGTVFLHFGHDRIANLRGVRSDFPVTVFAFGIAGVSLMGLPPSGGFIAKWLLLTTAMESAQWWWALIIIAGSLLASSYIFRVMSQFFVVPEKFSTKNTKVRSYLLEWPAFAMALFSLLLGLCAAWPLQFLTTDNFSLTLLSLGGIP